MTKQRSSKSASAVLRRKPLKVVPQEAKLIRVDFGDYLSGLSYAPYTVEYYQRRLLRLAGWLCEHHGRPRMRQLTRGSAAPARSLSAGLSARNSGLLSTPLVS